VEYRERHPALKAAGVEVTALSVDDAIRSSALRRDLGLPFPILCDTRREIIVKWGLLNEKEKGGIAFPAVFAIDPKLIVRFRSLDKTASRANPTEVSAIVDTVARGGAAREIRRRWVHPGTLFLRALRNAISRGTLVPWRS